jgi:hypothetical protein
MRVPGDPNIEIFLEKPGPPVHDEATAAHLRDSRPVGGTCQLRGCDPKKVLVGVSELVDWSQRMLGKGVSGPPLSINWPELIRFKRTFTDPAPHENEEAASLDHRQLDSFRSVRPCRRRRARPCPCRLTRPCRVGAGYRGRDVERQTTRSSAGQLGLR